MKWLVGIVSFISDKILLIFKTKRTLNVLSGIFFYVN